MDPNKMIEAVMEGKSPRVVVNEGSVVEGYHYSIENIFDAVGYLDSLVDQFDDMDDAGDEDMSDKEWKDWQKLMKSLKTAQKDANDYIKKWGKIIKARSMEG